MLRFYRSALFLVCTFLAWGWFALLMRADRATRGMWLPRALIWLPTPAAVAWLVNGNEGQWWWLLASGVGFYVLDVAFNWFVGTLIWWRAPRELTYTARLKALKSVRTAALRKLEKDPGNADALRDMRRTEGFDWQASILNGIDPGHV